MRRRLSASSLLVAVFASGIAAANGHVFTATHPTWKSECGSCHIAYPPQLLPARSWRALMANLPDHFGVDASLDAKSLAEVSAFLEQNAGRERDSSAEPVLRITETRWFRHEHEEELAPTIWRHPKVKSAANCAACHTRAEQGDFSERSLIIPR